MFFNGDLNKFYQPDLIMFLANLGKEGMLTVTSGDINLSVCIKGSVITEAYSERADAKLLRSLLFRGLIHDRQVTKIGRMKQETGMQALHILAELNLVERTKVLPELETAIREVLLQFFLLETGKFQFINVPVEGEGHGIPCQGIVLDLVHQVDEWKDLDQGKVPMDRIAVSRVPEKVVQKIPYPARHIIEAATGRSVGQIIEYVPLYSFTALKIINLVLDKNLLELKAPVTAPVEEKTPPRNALLQSFKKAYGHILEPRGGETRLDRLVSFCKYYFDQTAVFTVRGGRVVRCVSYEKDPAGGVLEADNRDLNAVVEEEPVFAGVNRSGVAFFGKLVFSDLMGRLLDLPAAGECALLLVEKLPDESVFLFARSNKASSNAFQYLKFFSDLMAPTEETIRGDRVLSMSERAAELIADIDDIPSMPQVVTRVLQILPDSRKSMADFAAALSEDQAMVARIIRVGNSALYRTVEEVRSLNQALARLGIKAIRSILLSSATKNLLPTDKRSGGMWNRGLWQHAKECALASRRIAAYVKYPDPEEAFAGGMLHDMGKLVILLKRREEYQQIRKLQVGENLRSIEAERSVLGFSHSDIGSLLMEKWHMPEVLKACVQYHHQSALSMSIETLPRIVAYGNSLSNLYGLNESVGADVYAEEINSLRGYFNLGEADAAALESRVMDDFKHADVFD